MFCVFANVPLGTVSRFTYLYCPKFTVPMKCSGLEQGTRPCEGCGPQAVQDWVIPTPPKYALQSHDVGGARDRGEAGEEEKWTHSFLEWAETHEQSLGFGSVQGPLLASVAREKRGKKGTPSFPDIPGRTSYHGPLCVPVRLCSDLFMVCVCGVFLVTLRLY